MEPRNFKIKTESPPKREAGFTLPLAHFSPSSLTLAMTCPEQFRQRYILGKRSRPGQAPMIGRVVHEAHEYNFRQKVSSFENVSTTEIVDYYHDEAWPTQIEQALEKDGEVIWDDKPDEARAAGESILAAYHRQVSPRVQPIKVEQEHRFDIGLPLEILSYIDIEQEHSIIDQKTGKQNRAKPKVDWVLKAKIYQMAVPKRFEWHISAMTKTPGIYTPVENPGLVQDPGTTLATKKMLRQVAWELNHLYETYGPDETWPGALTHDWACNYCGFRPDCEWRQ